MRRSRPSRKRNLPATPSNRSHCAACTCKGTKPPGRTKSSPVTRPGVRSRKTMHCPVTGSEIASILCLIGRFNHMTKSSAQTTKQQIAQAALAALRTEGFGGATSRAIARIGGFNQALIFYHYGSLENVLLAALDLTSMERMARYRDAVDNTHSVEELVQVARRIYREDSESG